MASGIHVPVVQKLDNGHSLRSLARLAFIVGSVVGAKGAILGTQIYPTEKGIYLSEFLSSGFLQMRAQNLPAPKVIWVDDQQKYHQLILDLVSDLWSNSLTVIGQDWFHFFHQGCLLIFPHFFNFDETCRLPLSPIYYSCLKEAH